MGFSCVNYRRISRDFISLWTKSFDFSRYLMCSTSKTLWRPVRDHRTQKIIEIPMKTCNFTIFYFLLFGFLLFLHNFLYALNDNTSFLKQFSVFGEGTQLCSIFKGVFNGWLKAIAHLAQGSSILTLYLHSIYILNQCIL